MISILPVYGFISKCLRNPKFMKENTFEYRSIHGVTNMESVQYEYGLGTRRL